MTNKSKLFILLIASMLGMFLSCTKPSKPTAEELSIKDIEIGESLKYRHGPEAVYIGSFYNTGYYLYN